MRHIEASRATLSEDVDLAAAEAALDAEIAADVLRQSLAAAAATARRERGSR